MTLAATAPQPRAEDTPRAGAESPRTRADDVPRPHARTPFVLDATTWRTRAEQHAARADALTAGHRDRRARGEKHAIEDFLFEYYPAKPAQLRRWHPGAGFALAAAAAGSPHAGWSWYRTDPAGVAPGPAATPTDPADPGPASTVGLDVDAFLADRGDTVRYVRGLVGATAARPAATGCFGLHEWAMVYREGDDAHRHALPLRLGGAGTDRVVEAHRIRCTHIDAFRFFTPPAVPLNTLQPSRETQVAMEQPGCLHANMDLYKWALKLGPAVPGELLLDAFALAREIRVVDMRASPYDVSAYGLEPIAIETTDGKADYVRRQRGFAVASQALRARLLAACDAVLGPETAA